ncbi:hypothetical protein [Nocardia sp. NPDC057455]|uniref:hypothetical protein n=1 Tax=Nocardia sp. NPDC057455 TaxID=3346138 RepID=UPI0036700183
MITTAELAKMAESARLRGDEVVAEMLYLEVHARKVAAEVPDDAGRRHWSSAAEVPDGVTFYHSRQTMYVFTREGEHVRPHGADHVVDCEYVDSAFVWTTGDFVEVPG